MLKEEQTKCHFPMIAVLYPSSFNTSAMVTSLCSRPVIRTPVYMLSSLLGLVDKDCIVMSCTLSTAKN